MRKQIKKAMVASSVMLALCATSVFAQKVDFPGQRWWGVLGRNLSADTNICRLEVWSTTAGTAFVQPLLDTVTATGITDASGLFTVTANAALSNLTVTYAIAIPKSNTTERVCQVASLGTGTATFQVFKSVEESRTIAAVTNTVQTTITLTPSTNVLEETASITYLGVDFSTNTVVVVTNAAAQTAAYTVTTNVSGNSIASFVSMTNAGLTAVNSIETNTYYVILGFD